MPGKNHTNKNKVNQSAHTNYEPHTIHKLIITIAIEKEKERRTDERVKEKWMEKQKTACGNGQIGTVLVIMRQTHGHSSVHTLHTVNAQCSEQGSHSLFVWKFLSLCNTTLSFGCGCYSYVINVCTQFDIESNHLNCTNKMKCSEELKTPFIWC